MNKQVSLKKNYLYNALFQLSAVLVPLITTPYISRVLKADGVGIYSYTLSNVTYFTMFATLGAAVYGQLQIAANRDDEQLRSRLFFEIFFARCVTTGVILVLYLLFIVFFSRYTLMYVILILNILSAMMDVSWYLHGLEQFRITAVKNILVKLISTAMIFLFVHKKGDLYIYALIMQGSTFIGNLVLWPNIRSTLVRVPFRELEWYRHYKKSIIYFIPSFATSVYTVLDKSMIGWITGSEFQNGYYEQAHKIEQVLVAVVTSLGTVTMPRVAYLLKNEKQKEAKEIINTATKFIIFLAVPMMVGLWSVAGYLVPWFLGEGFEECIPLLQIFSILMLVVGLDNTIGKQCLMASGRQNHYNKGVICGACVNIVMNAFLIPRYSATGAAAASVSAEIVILAVFMYESRDLLDLKMCLFTTVRYLLCSMIMIVIARFAARLGTSNLQCMLIEIVIAVIVYGGILALIKDEMIDEAKNLLKRKLHKA